MKQKLLSVIVLLIIVVSSWLAFNDDDSAEPAVSQSEINTTESALSSTQIVPTSNLDGQSTTSNKPTVDTVEQQSLPQMLPEKGVTIESNLEHSQRIVVPDKVVDAMMDEQQVNN
ncbi:hypothetical protein L0B53_06505 [Vibrio sp. SS-MA-C1-2]|uniref:hypothetical protein n=1 Tax=Vibrio sp. SS-MA-C1-2 TaxID=2908646 RepID=UPI001F37E479|nr:hypothetical protein [Vibrio sp. SS-MA-C1-2]UJF19221.1 hypothetical protein L0B53_06505 [Vibrio sp. SS-MA-C1-2]